MEMYKIKIEQGLMSHLFINTAKVIFFTIVTISLVIGYFSHFLMPASDIFKWLGCFIFILSFRFIIAVIAQKNIKNQVYYYKILVVTSFILGGLLGFFYWTFYFELNILQRFILLLAFVGLA